MPGLFPHNKFQSVLRNLTDRHGWVWIAALFLALQLYKLFYLAPPPDYVWDNVYLWDWARNVSLGNFSGLVVDSHHHLRWGDWAFAAVLIQFFSDEVFYYYLSTAIPSIAAGMVFIYLAWRHIGVWPTLVFVLLWYFNSELFRATFQLLPTGQGLLPSALILLALSRICQLQKVDLRFALFISLCLFWLYGVKETYLAFAPAVAWLLWRVGGLRPLLVLTAVFVVGYIAETLMFRYMSSDFSILGRIHAVVDGGQHVKIMLGSEHYVAQQTRYFDSGITRRWVQAIGTGSIIYFPAFVCAMLFVIERSKANRSSYNALDVTSLMFLSFAFFTTFFVISVSPIRLGHGLVSRYLAISLPFCYLLIIAFVSLQMQGAALKYKLGVLAVLPFFLAADFDRFMKYPQLSITEISKRYNTFAEELKSYDCARSHARETVHNQLDLVPLARRSQQSAELINRGVERYEKPWHIVSMGAGPCKNLYTIHRQTNARY